MTANNVLFRIAVLDDYQNVALSMADWSVLDGRATVTVFNDHLADIDAVVARLQPFDIVCIMRERTPMSRAVISRLPKLRLIASTAPRNAAIDLKAASVDILAQVVIRAGGGINWRHGVSNPINPSRAGISNAQRDADRSCYAPINNNSSKRGRSLCHDPIKLPTAAGSCSSWPAVRCSRPADGRRLRARSRRQRDGFLIR
jgi:hypothetical protein